MSSSHNLHWRLSRFYFFYYFFVGSFVPYWGIYLQSENFSPSSIGILLSLFQISRIVAPNFWGWLADHTGHRVKWIKLTSFLGLIGFIGVFWAKGFFWIFLVMSALSLFTSSTLPLAESLTLAHLATTDGHYSRIRLWGSIGFIVASLFLGYLIDLQGINILLWVLLIAQAIIFFLSNTIPETQEIHHKKKKRLHKCSISKNRNVTDGTFLSRSHHPHVPLFPMFHLVSLNVFVYKALYTAWCGEPLSNWYWVGSV